HKAYVINSNGETLSRIDLATKTVTNNILTLGTDVYSYPNQIIVRDTLAYVVNSGTSEIQIINLNTESTLGYIGTGAGTNPYWMAFADARFAYVSLMYDNSVAKIDVIDRTVVGVDSVGKRPEGIVIHDYKAYIACTGYNPDWSLDPFGKVAVYDLRGDSVLKEITVGTNPQHLAVDRQGRVHVVCTGDYFSVFSEIYVIDTDIDELIDGFELGGTPGLIKIGPDDIAYLPAAGWDSLSYVYSYNSLTLGVYHDENDPLVGAANCLMAVPYQDTSIFTGGWTHDDIKVIDSGGTLFDTYLLGDGPLDVAFDYLPGDLTGDHVVDIADITRMISWLYLDGAYPLWPAWRANVNGDYHYDISDITFLINYLYLSGDPAPKVGPDWFMPWAEIKK
ncbi:MAG: hypothetical protein ACOYVF_10865, partial [Candidatus Zixiibacteriota bacterium]